MKQVYIDFERQVTDLIEDFSEIVEENGISLLHRHIPFTVSSTYRNQHSSLTKKKIDSIGNKILDIISESS